MPHIDDLLPSEWSRTERLARERVARVYIQRIFDAVLADRWDAVHAIYQEARRQDDWMQVAVWGGLPNTIKDKLRELDHETRGTGRAPGRNDPDVAE